MRLRRRLSPLKLTVLGGTLFMVILVVLQRDVGSGSLQDPWLQDLSNKKERVFEMVRGAVNNFAFQIGAPQPPSVGVVPTPDRNCPPGFYTQADLKPWIERPPQEDPQAPEPMVQPSRKPAWLRRRRRKRRRAWPGTALTSLPATESPCTAVLEMTPVHPSKNGHIVWHHEKMWNTNNSFNSATNPP